MYNVVNVQLAVTVLAYIQDMVNLGSIHINMVQCFPGYSFIAGYGNWQDDS